MAVYYDPRVGSGSGNLMSAIGAWDHFLGPESKRLATQAQDAQLAVKLHANDLETSNLDLADKKGSMTSFGQAEPDLRIPTTQMTPEQYGRWSDLHTKNGVKDLARAGDVWNHGALNTWGKISTPQGGMATEFGTGPNGITATGIVLPPQIQSPQTPPGASSTPDFSGFDAERGPVGVQSPQSQPAQSGASAPSGSGDFAVPDLTPQEALVPYFRQWHDYQIGQAAKKQELAKGSLDVEKARREEALGSDEVQKREGEFSESARQLSNMLPDLESTVNGSRFGNVDKKGRNEGNYELDMPIIGDPTGAALLKTLPGDIAKNWKRFQNPGGAPLKPGQEDQEANNLIPMPGQNSWGVNLGGIGLGPSNEMTTKAIRDKEDQLVQTVKDHENDPAARLPILGLNPEVRKLVGPPPQRLIDAAAAQGKDVSEFTNPQKAGQAQPQQFGSMDDFSAAKNSGQIDQSRPAIIGGRPWVYSATRGGKAGWWPQDSVSDAQQANFPTNRLPNVQLNALR